MTHVDAGRIENGWGEGLRQMRISGMTRGHCGLTSTLSDTPNYPRQALRTSGEPRNVLWRDANAERVAVRLCEVMKEAQLTGTVGAYSQIDSRTKSSPRSARLVEREDAREAFLQGPPAHAAACLRLRPGQQRARHEGTAGLPRAPQHSTHGAVHRVVSDAVQRFLAQMKNLAVSVPQAHGYPFDDSIERWDR